MLTLLVNTVATMVFTVLLMFGSLLLSAVIMAIAGIGILLSGVLKTDDDFSPVLKFEKRAEALERL
jgi:hypothetical protein